MKTRDMSTWAVHLDSVRLLDYEFEFDSAATYIIYEPQLPYIYLPERDFLTYMGYASSFFSTAGEDDNAKPEIHCNYRQRGTCRFDATCTDVIT